MAYEMHDTSSHISRKIGIEACIVHESWRPLFDAIGDSDLLGSVRFTAAAPRFISIELLCEDTSVQSERLVVPFAGDISVRYGPATSLRAAKEKPTRAGFHLDHFSLNSSRFRADVSTWTRFLGRAPILEEAVSWSAADKAHVKAAHFFGDFRPYITIRDMPHCQALDHIGFRCEDKSKVYDAYACVRALGWAVLGEPELLDGSVLFHFQGPDRRVHDFFFPEAFI